MTDSEHVRCSHLVLVRRFLFLFLFVFSAFSSHSVRRLDAWRFSTMSILVVEGTLTIQRQLQTIFVT